MKHLLHIFILVLFCNVMVAQQNLVPNASFENQSNCPTAEDQLIYATGWLNCGTGSPDLYHTCSASMDASVPKNRFGHQVPHAGNAYVGMFIHDGLEYREYIETALSATLSPGTKYYFSFYASLADTFSYSSSSIGAYFSNNLLSAGHYSPITVTNQIQNNAVNFFDSFTWKKVTGSFIASGGEHYLTLGNFRSGANSPSLAVNNSQPPYNSSRVYLYIDDLCLSSDSLYNATYTTAIASHDLETEDIKLYPNPASDYLEIDAHSNIEGITITTTNGAQIQVPIISGKQSMCVSIKDFEDGIYYLSLKCSTGLFGKKIVIQH